MAEIKNAVNKTIWDQLDNAPECECKTKKKRFYYHVEENKFLIVCNDCFLKLEGKIPVDEINRNCKKHDWEIDECNIDLANEITWWATCKNCPATGTTTRKITIPKRFNEIIE